MDEEQWELTWELYEQEFALGDLPYIEVTHTKPDGRLHKHRVYSRIDVDTGTAVTLSFTKVRNEKVARMLEYYFQHPLTIGKHNRSVMNHLKKDGFEELVQWLEAGNAPDADRPTAETSPNEAQQQKRTKIPVAEVKHDLQTAYQQTDNGQSFEVAIAAKGYLLARGDRRAMVIVDEAGGIHSPSRRLGVKTKDLKSKWSDISLEHLPTIEQVKEARDEHRRIKNIRKNNSPDEALKKLHEEAQRVAQEIRDLERQYTFEKEVNIVQRKATDVAAHCAITRRIETIQKTENSEPSEKTTDDTEKTMKKESKTQQQSTSENVSIPETKKPVSQTPNERELIETFWDMTLDPERGKRSSRESSEQKNASFHTTTQNILSLTGQAAEQEKLRLLERAKDVS